MEDFMQNLSNYRSSYLCLRKKRPLRKFDAKASFGVGMSVSDVVFREESEFEVTNSPKLFKKHIFQNLKILENLKILKFLKINNFQNFQNFQVFIFSNFEKLCFV